jgi:hypothetical protein
VPGVARVRSLHGVGDVHDVGPVHRNRRGRQPNQAPDAREPGREPGPQSRVWLLRPRANVDARGSRREQGDEAPSPCAQAQPGPARGEALLAHHEAPGRAAARPGATGRRAEGEGAGGAVGARDDPLDAQPGTRERRRAFDRAARDAGASTIASTRASTHRAVAFDASPRAALGSRTRHASGRQRASLGFGSGASSSIGPPRSGSGPCSAPTPREPLRALRRRSWLGARGGSGRGASDRAHGDASCVGSILHRVIATSR